MTFSMITSYILYGLSGCLFGIFASRYSVLSAWHIKAKYREQSVSALLSCLPQLLFLFVAFFLFPTWFITKTPTGGFFYYALLIFFFSRGMRMKQ